jgi:hypothetical protein
MRCMVRNAAILERVIEPARGSLTPDLARYILQLDFPPRDHERYISLSTKAQTGALTSAEEAELDDYLSIDAFLGIIQSKARHSLKKHNDAA